MTAARRAARTLGTHSRRRLQAWSANSPSTSQDADTVCCGCNGRCLRGGAPPPAARPPPARRRHSGRRCGVACRRRDRHSAILLHPPLPSVGVPTVMERESVGKITVPSMANRRRDRHSAAPPFSRCFNRDTKRAVSTMAAGVSAGAERGLQQNNSTLADGQARRVHAGRCAGRGPAHWDAIRPVGSSCSCCRCCCRVLLLPPRAAADAAAAAAMAAAAVAAATAAAAVSPAAPPPPPLTSPSSTGTNCCLLMPLTSPSRLTTRGSVLAFPHRKAVTARQAALREMCGIDDFVIPTSRLPPAPVPAPWPRPVPPVSAPSVAPASAAPAAVDEAVKFCCTPFSL